MHYNFTLFCLTTNYTIPKKCLVYMFGWNFLNCCNRCFFSLGLSMIVFIISISPLFVHSSVCRWYSDVVTCLQKRVSENKIKKFIFHKYLPYQNIKLINTVRPDCCNLTLKIDHTNVKVTIEINVTSYW